MDPAGGCGGLEARRLLEIAQKLLDACWKQVLRERAFESNSVFYGVGLILAFVDVLLAIERPMNSELDCYVILQLPHSSSGQSDDSITVKRRYRRLALLLSPSRINAPLTNYVFRFVVDACQRSPLSSCHAIPIGLLPQDGHFLAPNQRLRC
ncbi:hypothetical protein IEQ34_017290 [Dendrobium chrysotoxum]|uniref:Uncharacterized protein n=1 Tax=Dendrobium chrysotoxum TaxID=161865 RepID=A0AAV7G965_DENCH|nr:hypothetical protein IEQ34_017290 [Dendrobium chrysotoxum]